MRGFFQFVPRAQSLLSQLYGNLVNRLGVCFFGSLFRSIRRGCAPTSPRRHKARGAESTSPRTPCQALGPEVARPRARAFLKPAFARCRNGALSSAPVSWPLMDLVTSLWL